MKRSRLLLAALASVVLAVCFGYAGWFSDPPPKPPPSEADTLSAAWRYNQCHARHWRYLLLQR
jgi:hypothetical protein